MPEKNLRVKVLRLRGQGKHFNDLVASQLLLFLVVKGLFQRGIPGAEVIKMIKLLVKFLLTIYII